ncbi:hypothetical protein OJAV_G00038220 [Oryzias javanicus]|uniref:Uncharacterized protein n=1 Tax=Oryzias javanicus TaxID=123683 RepID=A0A437DGH4_ORYJA|nr:hypothetical protein OJAV_G00038220 [Oryzias javanicus]
MFPTPSSCKRTETQRREADARPEQSRQTGLQRAAASFWTFTLKHQKHLSGEPPLVPQRVVDAMKKSFLQVSVHLICVQAASLRRKNLFHCLQIQAKTK